MIILFMSFAVIVGGGCGDAAEKSSQPSSEAKSDCPRLELEEFDDCTYEESMLALHEPESLDAFCQSTCNKAQSIEVRDQDDPDAAGLEDLSVLRGLEKVESLSVMSVGSLKSLHGLEQLEEVETTLQIWYNWELQSVEALSSLERVGVLLALRGNNGLTDLSGLESLRDVKALTIKHNDKLESIAALFNIESLEESYTVHGNPMLPTCQVEGLKEHLSVPDESALIFDNGDGTCE